jgi:transcriptional regulator GlxA family with amidase domain
MALTNVALKALKPKEKSYKRADERGLYIEVMPNGSKLWRYKYRLHGVEKRLSMGRYPDVILCVPGGHGVVEALQDPATRDFVAHQGQGARWITSVCTGAFVLGAAGLLRGRRATTHWAYTHLLSKVGAGFAQRRVVEDGNLVTCGGVTAGLDFALTLIAREAGERVAQTIQLALEYDPAPPFAAGHPSRAPEGVTATLRERVYDEAAERMAAALETLDSAASPAS